MLTQANSMPCSRRRKQNQRFIQSSVGSFFERKSLSKRHPTSTKEKMPNKSAGREDWPYPPSKWKYSPVQPSFQRAITSRMDISSGVCIARRRTISSVALYNSPSRSRYIYVCTYIFFFPGHRKILNHFDFCLRDYSLDII